MCNITKSIQAVIAYSGLQIIFFFSTAAEVTTDDTESTEEVYYFQIHVKLGSLLSSMCVFQPETQADAGILWLAVTLFLCLRTKTKQILYDLIHQKTKENDILQSDKPEDIPTDGENQVITSPVSYTTFFHLNGIH